MKFECSYIRNGFDIVTIAVSDKHPLELINLSYLFIDLKQFIIDCIKNDPLEIK